MTVSDPRFGQSSVDEILQLLAQKKSASTKRSTKAAVQYFLEFMVATNRIINLDSYTVEDLATLVGALYVDAR
jgi:hypothetical protein